MLWPDVFGIQGSGYPAASKNWSLCKPPLNPNRTFCVTAPPSKDAPDASGNTQREVAEEVGFPRGNVISMLRSGEMRLPIERAPALARALGIDEKLLIGTAVTKYMPETWSIYAVARGSHTNKDFRCNAAIGP